MDDVGDCDCKQSQTRFGHNDKSIKFQVNSKVAMDSLSYVHT